MKSRVKDIVEIGDRLFSTRGSLHSLWQEMALNFYPERADFTTNRSLGAEFAEHLMTGNPSLARRDLANSLSSMLRPRGQPWFYARTKDESINKDQTSRMWLDRASDIQRNIMYDAKSRFIRATKEGDNDFATFGQCAISVDLRRARDGLLYRCWHLRDVAWSENAELEVDQVHHNWKIAARDLIALYPDKVPATVRTAAEKEPFKEIKCRRVILPAEQYDLEKKSNRRALPYVCLLVDTENQVLLEEGPVKRINYAIPRWQTVSGSQYAHSPASVIALPDARLLQQITLTLLEAGQKVVDPPLIATREMISGGVNTFAGGITWVDAEYDERLGEVLRPMTTDAKGLNWGVDREERIQQMIHKAFFLDQLGLPDLSGEKMTAYETRIRLEEYTRRALPLFEPMESEYNGALCDMTFEIAMEQGAFGSPFDMPPALRGQEVSFQFESPIQAASKRANAQVFQQSAQLLAIAAQIDQSAVHDFDVRAAFRDALDGTGAPADWIVPKEQADQAAQAGQQEAAAQAQVQNAIGTISGGADAAHKVGQAAQQLQAAGVM